MSKVSPLLASPKSGEWETPPDLFQALDGEFQFQLDAAASARNTLCRHFFTEDMDGLRFHWHTRARSVWCNPPYGTQIGRWVRKAFEESRSGATVVMLIPARTDTRYWHDYVMRAAEIRLIRGRLRFSGATINAPFPSAVVVFRPGDHVPKLVAIEANGLPVDKSAVVRSRSTHRKERGLQGACPCVTQGILPVLTSLRQRHLSVLR